MAKTKPIGVRFDEDILKQIGGTAQSVLITLENFYRGQKLFLDHKGNPTFKTAEEGTKIKIDTSYEPPLQFKNDVERMFWEEDQKFKIK